MAIEVASGELNSPTTTGDVAYAVTSFTPKAIIFWSNSVSAGSSTTSYLRKMFGFTTGASNSECHSIQAEGNAGTGHKVIRGFSGSLNYCIYTNVVNVTSVGLAAKLKTFDATGFTLTWDTVEASSFPIQWLALGGSDMSAKVSSFVVTPPSSEEQTITGVGFTPRVAFFVVSRLSTTASGFSNSSGNFSLGAATSSQSRWCSAFYLENNDAVPDTFGALYNTQIVRTIVPSNKIDFVNFNSDGFVVEKELVSSSSIRVSYLCLGGGGLGAVVGTDTTKTSTTGTKAVTGVGITPTLIMLGGEGTTALNTQTGSVSTFFGTALSSSNRRVCSATRLELVTPTETASYTSSSLCLAYLTYGSTGTAIEADYSSFDVDGFTLNYLDVISSARHFGYIVLGLAVPVTGIQGMGQIGSVTLILDQTVFPTSLSGLGEIGTPLIVNEYIFSVTGLEGTGQIGNETVTTSSDVITILATGVEGAGQIGTVTTAFDNIFAVTGVQGTGQLGTPAINFDYIFDVAGVQGTGQIGSVAFEIEGNPWEEVVITTTVSWSEVSTPNPGP